MLSMHAAAEDDGYVGDDEECEVCHDDLSHWRGTVHARVFDHADGLTERMRRGCEGCHGPGEVHVDEGDDDFGDLITFRAATPKARRGEIEVCLSCHSGGPRTYYQGSSHDSRDVSCTSCHTIMRSVSLRNELTKHSQTDTCAQCHLLPRSQMYRNSHHPVREGKMACGSCHNAHGTIADALIIQSTINDNCFSCHGDKRGPFLWDHAPAIEDCLSCHSAHGATRTGMLKVTVPRLCQQCHIPGGHPTDSYDPDDRFVLSKSCLNCHVNIHGSNHPSGNNLTR